MPTRTIGPPTRHDLPILWTLPPTDRERQTVIRMRGLRPVNAAWKVPTILTDASLQIELVRHLWLDMKLAGDIAVDRRATEEIGVAIPRANSRRAGLAAAGSRCQVAHRSAATERWSREGA